MKTKATVQFKIGDKLAFMSGWGSTYHVYEVSHVTPTGIATAGPYKVNADMSIRRKRERGYYGPFRAELVTDEILSKVRRQKCLASIEAVEWKDFTDETLFAICDIINAAKNRSMEAGE